MPVGVRDRSAANNERATPATATNVTARTREHTFRK